MHTSGMATIQDWAQDWKTLTLHPEDEGDNPSPRHEHSTQTQKLNHRGGA